MAAETELKHQVHELASGFSHLKDEVKSLAAQGKKTDEDIKSLGEKIDRLAAAGPPPGAAPGGAARISTSTHLAEPIVFVDMKERAGGSADDDPSPADVPEFDPVGSKSNPKRLPEASPGDALFVAVEQLAGKITNYTAATLDFIDGKLPSQLGSSPAPDLGYQETLVAAIYGGLERDGATDPSADGFETELVDILGEYNKNQDLYNAVLRVLTKSGRVNVLRRRTPTGPTHATGERQVRANWWMSISRTLRDQKVRYNELGLDEMVDKLLVSFKGAGEGLDPSAIQINIPNLDQSASNEIIKENLDAMQGVHFSAMLEQLKAFQVVDKLLSLFLQGMLPIVRGPAGDILYKYWKSSNDRISETERRSLYARVFGYPGGDPQEPPNREFQDLWLRFVSAVSSWYRQFSLSNVIDPTRVTTYNQEKMRRSGRDLAANLSLHGYGIAYFVATDLQNQINEMIRLLSDSEIKNAFGARDMFQVIEQVSATELGGAENTVRYRTMANAGAVIIRWLANHRSTLASANLAQLVNQNQVLSQISASGAGELFTKPTDYDLVEACEQWLAVTGTTEEKIDQFAQPVEPPRTTSRPIQIPAAARDLLDSVGVSASLNYRGNGNGKKQYNGSSRHTTNTAP